MTESVQEYPSEVKRVILLKALGRIAVARKEGRLSWDSKTVTYKSRLGELYKKKITEMPEFFLEVTGTTIFVGGLVGDISKELEEIFVKVLNTTKNGLDIDKMVAEREAVFNQLQKLSDDEQFNKDQKWIDESVSEIKKLKQGDVQ